MTERKPPGMTWESFAEQKIREAQEAGEFDHLPGLGQPLSSLDEPDDELWWIKQKLRRERLSLLPPALQIRREVELFLQRLRALPSEAVVRREVQALNARIREVHFTSVWGPPNTTLPLEVESVLERWRHDSTPAE